ncbi:uncharacterized protein BJ212DRAFT_1306422 [Suillus subaureus]|uniref:Uncharacterized protein n=1 Tax=Suillus subaureus TaxID=48587 RepID=A0A9P7AVV9_9AGAM|nr:uncharacterized protein BJ212DRAFT_1306422 [Suillus subaureus]KAG1796105.1 hypothetical protein BJ212DRAFT_1306422 [Suillus subaureus]
MEQSAPNKPPKLLVGELTPEAAHDWDNACSMYFMHKGSFTAYMIALKSTWLETHWATKLHKKVLGSQQGSCPFYEWALQLQNQNVLLYGNTAHLTDAQLHNQLKANICDELTTSVLRARLTDNLTLKEWIEEVKHLNDKWLKDLTSHKKIMEELYKALRCTTSSNHTKNPSSSKPYNSSSCLGSLTETECTLLMDHKGCFKCQKFYITHQSKECTDGAPDASSYKMLMEADTLAAKSKNKKQTKLVATVAPIVAVMPSSILDEGSDSEDDMCIAPFETAHLFLALSLDGPLL